MVHLHSLGLWVAGSGDGSLLHLGLRVRKALPPRHGVWTLQSSICLLWAPEPELELLVSQTEVEFI